MRITAALVVLLLAGRAAAEVPSIDDAIARAAAARKLLVVEFGAAWCKPCREFERTVLVDRAVVAALATVVFVRYDVDTPIGHEAATRYKVGGYPTFLVLDARGGETFRALGVPTGKAAIAWFLEVLRTGRSAISPLEQLRAAVTANPQDNRARLDLARALRDLGQTPEAIAQYAAVADSPHVDSIDAAEAEAALDDIRAAEHRVEAVLATARVFVGNHPASPLTSQRIALLAVARPRPADLEDTIAKHLAAVRAIDRPDAVRAAILAGAAAQARAALASWTDGDPRHARLMAAELAIDATQRDEAARLIAPVCDAQPTGVERWCLDLHNALRTGGHVVPGVSTMRVQAHAILDDLRRPGIAQLDPMRRTGDGIANAVARAVLAADRTCGWLARLTPRVSVEVDLAAAGGPPRRVTIKPEDNAELATCIARMLYRTKLPATQPSDDPHVHALLVFDGAQRRRPFGYPASDRLDHGVVASFANRRGALGSGGVAVDSLLDLAGVAQLRLVGSLQLELGIVDSGRTAYAGRALLGFGYAVTPRLALELGAGAGTSRYGEDVPRAFEIPFELRARISVARDARIHLWARGAYVFDDDRAASSSAMVGAHEWSAGVGASGRALGGLRVFGAAIYEQRALGHSSLFVIGLPFGGYF